MSLQNIPPTDLTARRHQARVPQRLGAHLHSKTADRIYQSIIGVDRLEEYLTTSNWVRVRAQPTLISVNCRRVDERTYADGAKVK